VGDDCYGGGIFLSSGENSLFSFFFLFSVWVVSNGFAWSGREYNIAVIVPLPLISPPHRSGTTLNPKRVCENNYITVSVDVQSLGYLQPLQSLSHQRQPTRQRVTPQLQSPSPQRNHDFPQQTHKIQKMTFRFDETEFNGAVAMAYRSAQTWISLGNASKMSCWGRDNFGCYYYWDAPPVFSWGDLRDCVFLTIRSVVEDGSLKRHRLGRLLVVRDTTFAIFINDWRSSFVRPGGTYSSVIGNNVLCRAVRTARDKLSNNDFGVSLDRILHQQDPLERRGGYNTINEDMSCFCISHPKKSAISDVTLTPNSPLQTSFASSSPSPHNRVTPRSESGGTCVLILSHRRHLLRVVNTASSI